MNVLVAMSGGVDSSVAAARLVEQGHRVIGATLRLMKKETGFGCCGASRDIDDARAVCVKLNVPHYVLDFSDEFAKNILNPFVASYIGGETPNPCIACNRFVKFDALLKKAVGLGADAVATGHYARVHATPSGPRLARAVDRRKDQSYVLYHLGPAELPRLMFPVGDMTKDQVRDAARRWDLRTAEKPESMEICFVPGADTAGFVKSQAEAAGMAATTLSPGPIVDTAGARLGTHRGVAYYTRGQRQGLGLALGRPVYVVDLDPATNTVVVGDDAETSTAGFAVRDVSWTLGRPPADEFDAHVQIRAHHEAAPARVRVTPHGVDVLWRHPQRAVTPGQAAVFYEGDDLWGGGTIDRTTTSEGERA
jgi:tRNA-specific 2-thiouridylase